MEKEFQDILIFARDRWDGVWRRRHHLAVEFAAQGRRVLFVEPPRRPGARIGLREVHPGVQVFTAMKAAPWSVEVLRRANLASIALHLGIAVRTLHFHNPLAWVTAEYGVHLVDAVSARRVIYDVTDDWTLAPLSAVERDQIERDDAAMLRRADLVSAVSEQLVKSRGASHPRVRWLPNAVPEDFFTRSVAPPAELADISLPIAGYVGTLHTDRLDIALVDAVAARAEGKFALVFVGPSHLSPEDTALLSRRPNVRFIGTMPAVRLPAFLQAFRVCTIPHRVTPFTNSLDPIKIYEYLAAGKPVVSTPVAGVLPYRRFVELAEDTDAFFRHIAETVDRGDPPDASDRIAFARQNTWSVRAKEALRWATGPI